MEVTWETPEEKPVSDSKENGNRALYGAGRVKGAAEGGYRLCSPSLNGMERKLGHWKKANRPEKGNKKKSLCWEILQGASLWCPLAVGRTEEASGERFWCGTR